MIWPLALYFLGGTWLIAEWCEMRADFRSFRLDRASTLTDRDSYPDQISRRLLDFIRRVTKNGQ